MVSSDVLELVLSRPLGPEVDLDFGMVPFFHLEFVPVLKILGFCHLQEVRLAEVDCLYIRWGFHLLDFLD